MLLIERVVHLKPALIKPEHLKLLKILEEKSKQCKQLKTMSLRLILQLVYAKFEYCSFALKSLAKFLAGFELENRFQAFLWAQLAYLLLQEERIVSLFGEKLINDDLLAKYAIIIL